MLDACPSWQGFADLHRCADRTILDHKAFAIDDALEGMLDRMRRGQYDTTSGSERRRVKNHLTNRTKIHRHRANLVRTKLAHGAPLYDETRPANSVILMEQLGQIRAQTTEVEYESLYHLAAGDAYADIARRRKVPVGTLKAEVSRCRARLRRCA